MTSDGHGAPTATLTTPSDREIRIERVFDAPRDRVFAVYTDPALIPQWWGPTTVVDHMDVKPGGSWRFVVSTNGWETAFRGTYQEVEPPVRIVQTFEAEAMPGRIHVETITFEDLGDRTMLTNSMHFDTTEERDTVLSYGAEKGANETYARIDALLATPATG